MRFWLSMESQKRRKSVIMDIHNWIIMSGHIDQSLIKE